MHRFKFRRGMAALLVAVLGAFAADASGLVDGVFGKAADRSSQSDAGANRQSE